MNQLKKHNRGVVLILCYTIISGFNAVFSSLNILVSIELSEGAAALTALSFLLGILGIITVVGVWKFKKWALNLLKAVYTISIPMTAYVLISSEYIKTSGYIVLQLIEIIIALAIILYLMKPEIIRNLGRI